MMFHCRHSLQYAHILAQSFLKCSDDSHCPIDKSLFLRKARLVDSMQLIIENLDAQ